MKIAILFWEDRDIESYPSIINAAELWVKDGCLVEILVPESMRSQYNKPGITICYLENKSYEYVREAYNCLKKADYDLYIAYDNYGLYPLIKLKNKVPIIFHSLEIIDYKPKLKLLSKNYFKLLAVNLPRWKIFDKRCKERIIFSIVQDPDREKLLRKVYGFVDKVVLVPNSNLGIYNKKSDYLRRKYKLSKNKKIILYSGALESWALDNKIIEASIAWPDDWIFIMHGFDRDGTFYEQIKPIAQKYSQKLFVNLDFLDKDTYDEMVCSADIGLAWYKKDLTENVHNLGASSGKIFQYLYCGLPVIGPNYILSMIDIINTGKVGKVASDEKDIINSISEIFLNYNTYKQNVQDFYLKHYEFENHYSKVIKECKNLLR